MKTSKGIKRVNVAAALMTMFMAPIWRAQESMARQRETLGIPHGFDNSHGRKLPKGFRKHARARAKIARLARNSAIGVRTATNLKY